MDNRTPSISIWTYSGVLVALMLLLGVTIVLATIDLGAFNFLAAMFVASTKALLVLIFFMHLKTSPRLMALFIGFGFAWLVILVVFTMSDYLTRGWPGTSALPF